MTLRPSLGPGVFFARGSSVVVVFDVDVMQSASKRLKNLRKCHMSGKHSKNVQFRVCASEFHNFMEKHFISLVDLD